ncbi:hypothetical protein BK250_26540 [Escherichia coli]|nr:hypothetical protein BK250_26540 [Escherichia coli]
MISLETSASFLGVQNTGASTHRDNKLQLTASGLSEFLPDFSGKDIFSSIFCSSLFYRVICLLTGETLQIYKKALSEISVR